MVGRGGGWDEWGRGESREALSENGNGKRAAGFRNRNSALLLQRQRVRGRQAERVLLWGNRHNNTDETVQPQHVCMHTDCNIIHNTIYACYMQIFVLLCLICCLWQP